MALIKFSALITAVKGKLGGSVLQGGTYGNVIKQNAYHSRGKSNTMPVRIQNNLWNVQVWRSAAPVDRLAWVNASKLYPQLNKWGDPVILPGYQFWLLASSLFPNQFIGNIHYLPVSSGDISVGAFPVHITRVLKFQLGPFPVGQDTTLLHISVSAPQRATHSTRRTGWAYMLAYTTPSLMVDINHLYQRFYPTRYDGELIFIKVVPYSLSLAMWGPEFVVQAVVI